MPGNASIVHPILDKRLDRLSEQLERLEEIVNELVNELDPPARKRPELRLVDDDEGA
jgi:tetrahydromethanopterin S-methyltransferase subunit B